jgi:hypothetical protein
VAELVPQEGERTMNVKDLTGWVRDPRKAMFACGFMLACVMPHAGWADSSTATLVDPVVVTRILPELYSFPGEVMGSLTVVVSETEFVTRVVVEEQIPPGWTVIDATPAYTSMVDDLVTWVFEDETIVEEQVIEYLLGVPGDYCDESALFSGTCTYTLHDEEFTVSIAGKDSMESDDLCVGIKSISPGSGLPGDPVELWGYCYYYHSGRTGDIYFDGEYWITVSGDTMGNFYGIPAIPLDAVPGEHRISCENCTCDAVFVVVTPTPMTTATPTITATPSPTATSTPLPGDINRDGRVDEEDLLLFMGRWGQGRNAGKGGNAP